MNESGCCSNLGTTWSRKHATLKSSNKTYTLGFASEHVYCAVSLSGIEAKLTSTARTHFARTLSSNGQRCWQTKANRHNGCRGGEDISANTNEDSSLEVDSASSPVLVASPPSCCTGPALAKLQFDSWDDFHAFVSEYEAQTYQLFRTRTNKTVKARNANIKNPASHIPHSSSSIRKDQSVLMQENTSTGTKEKGCVKKAVGQSVLYRQVQIILLELEVCNSIPE